MNNYRTTLAIALAVAALFLAVSGAIYFPLRGAYEVGYRAGQIDYAAGIRRWIIGPGGQPHEIAP